MDLLSTKDLLRKNFAQLPTLPGEWGRFWGNLGAATQIFIYGRMGIGKSTGATVLAWLLSYYAPVLYVSAEEGLSATLRDRVRRQGTTSDTLLFSTYTTLEELKAAILRLGIGYVVLDSITHISPHSKEGARFLEWARKHNVGVVAIAHETKAGQYRGHSALPHTVDFVARVQQEHDDGEHPRSYFVREKARTGPDFSLMELTIPFTKGDLPKPPSAKPQRRKHGQKAGATRANGSRPNGSRPNPVKTPFLTTLRALDKQHKIRGAGRLNALVGWNSPCWVDMMEVADRLPKNDDTERMVERAGRAKFRFILNTKSRTPKDGGARDVRRVLTVHVYDEATHPDLFEVDPCDPIERAATVYEFTGDSFEASWFEALRALGNVPIVIEDQAHAKTVLGAKGYREREKAEGSAPPKAPRKRRAAKPKAAKPAKANKEPLGKGKKAAAATPAKPPRPPSPKKSVAKRKKAKPATARTAAPASGDGAAEEAVLGQVDAGIDRIEAMLNKALGS